MLFGAEPRLFWPAEFWRNLGVHPPAMQLLGCQWISSTLRAWTGSTGTSRYPLRRRHYVMRRTRAVSS